MKIIYSRWFPPGNYRCINLFGVFIAKKELSAININHESIHTAQGKEILWVFFYLWYVLEWLFRLIQYRDRKQAYYNISFEREAYNNQNNVNYLSERKCYSWVKYLKK